jgi:3',5'-cyclic AMP phosphodiesterase CpdA
MKRRTFIERIFIGSSSVIVGPQLMAGNYQKDFPQFEYGRPDTLKDVITKDGQVMIRVEVKGVSSLEPVDIDTEVEVNRGRINRVKYYFFEPGKQITDTRTGGIKAKVNRVDPGIIVVWIDNPVNETRIRIKLNGQNLDLRLDELVGKHEIEYTVGEVQLNVNYLLDHEIAFLTPEQMGLKVDDKEENYRFVIMADTQGGALGVPGSSDTRIQIHNAFIKESIKITNGLDPKPLFTLILGDIVDAQGEKEHFAEMHRYFEELKSPVLYEMGNHESSYRSTFSPGYKMDDFDNYYAAQKAINGMTELLYSFNIGKWHFVVWPDPLRSRFWETHPHYFDWLERDLEKHKDYQVMFLQHIPIHPIGIDPLINYAESVKVKRMVSDIISRHGKVRFVFSGHVHIPIRASFKTAVEYKGMKMINLPAAGYRPRAFGEEEWNGGPSQGVLVADIKGDKASVFFKTVTEEIYPYPEELPEFKEDIYSLWFSHKWELPAEKQIRNGSFEQGLDGWSRRFVYQETENPSNLMEVRKMVRESSFSALYLMSRKRGYAAPGQDRLPQNINHMCQAVKIEGKPGILKFDYLIDSRNTNMGKFCGAFVWIEGFRGSFHLLNMAYWVGFSEVNIGGNHSYVNVLHPHHFHLDETMDTWHSASLNLEKDAATFGKSISELNLDRLVINVGTWNVNDGNPVSFAAYFDRFRLEPYDDQSNVGGKPVAETPLDKKWWRGKYEPNVNIAGEHRYIMATKK